MQITENAKLGKWTLLHPSLTGEHWTCRCECGTVKQVLTYNLRQKKTKSCGCARTAAHHSAMATSLAGGGIYGHR